MFTLSPLAATLASSVGDIQSQIIDTQNQLSSGIKDLNPAQNGIVTRLSAQADAYGTVVGNITTAQAVIDVGQTALQSMADIVSQMKNLATQASSAGMSTTDLSSLNSTFTTLAGQLTAIYQGASVNGNSVIGGSNMLVTTGIDGSTASPTTMTVNAVNGSGIASGAQGYGLIATTGGSVPTSVFTAAATSPAYSAQTVTFTSALSAGQSVSVGGLKLTASSTGFASATAVAAAFRAYLLSGGSQPTDATTGSFSGSLGTDVNWTAAAASDATLTLTSQTPGTTVTAASYTLTLSTANTGAYNAAAAVAGLTTLLSTISTGQSTLSASSKGLLAKQNAAKALVSGLNAVTDSIQKVDATALQAKLQQLNNQQSIDYYLVSQMNTEAAAILSIFR
ncbi:hypothetical protein G6704_05680 [Polynucleobacter paneuropaeus]|nr:hypothetical protein G6704_05680 [Polynucleobacter paneuropaeus]